MNCKIFAFYLPQFHPISENDQWWGKGFTEWTNVGKARPLFHNHYQPRVPADLGYYDLRLAESRIAQAELAKKYHIDGFCYYHYWFGEGRELLQRPFNEVVQSKTPDFPFMLCWANESWHEKFWNYELKTQSKRILMEQKYDGEKDYVEHFKSLEKVFHDPRYFKIDNKPVFMVYRPFDSPEIATIITLWNQLALNSGFNGVFFIAQSTDYSLEGERALKIGFDAINSLGLFKPLKRRTLFTKIVTKIFLKSKYFIPYKNDYRKVYKYFLDNYDDLDNVFPTIIPNWDHSPRSGRMGYILYNSTPYYFGLHLQMVFDCLSRKESKPQVAFIKSWNEWGEGNYLEPDRKYGLGYLEEYARIWGEYNKE